MNEDVASVHEQAQHRLHTPGEDFSVETVPENETVHGLRIALVLIGIAITIPAFVTSSELGLAMGMDKVAIAIPIGSMFLCITGCFTAAIGAQSRLTTYMIIQFSFGRFGAKLVTLIVAITIFGWFTITASLFGESIHSAVADIWGLIVNLNLLIVAGSLLAIVTTVFGFKAIDKLALLSVPLMFAALAWLVYRTLDNTSIASLQTYTSDAMSLGQGITGVIGGFIVGVVIIPDYCRYVRNTAHALLTSIVHFGLGYPLVLLMLAVASIKSGEKNVTNIIIGMGFGVVGLLVLIFATWTSNVGNLYSSALGLKTIFTRVPHWLIIVVSGLLGAILAVLGVTRYFVDFLLFLGISIPPIAGIYIADYFFVHDRNYRFENLAKQPKIVYPAFFAWIVATLVAWMTTYGVFVLTSIPACDAILTAFVLYLPGRRLSNALSGSPVIPRSQVGSLITTSSAAESANQ